MKNKLEILGKLLDFSSEWLYWINNKGEVEYISKGVKRITGYSSEEFLKDKELFFKIIYEKDKKKVEGKNCLKSKKEHSFNFRIVRKDGKIIHIKHHCSPIINENGEVIGRLGKNIDITDIYHLEKKRKEVKKIFESFFDEFPEPACIIDRNYEIVSANKKILQITKKTREELAGKKCYEVYQNRNSPCKVCIPRQAFRKKIPVIKEKKVVLENGETRFFETWGLPVVEEKNKIPFVIGVLRDKTEKRILEQEKREKEEKLERIIRAIPDTLFYFDKKGYIIDYQGAGRPFSSLSKKRFLNKNVKEILPHPFGQKAYKLGRKAIREQKLQTVEFPLIIGKRERFFEARIIPDKKTNALAIVRDITREKELEKVLQETNIMYEEILKNSPIGIIKADKKGNILFANKRSAEIFGSPSVEHTMKINILKFHRLKEVGLSSRFKEAIEKGKQQQFESLYTSKWGKEVFLRIKIAPLFDKRNKTNGALLLVEDYTLEYILKKNLEVSEKKLKAIFLNIKDGIILANDNAIVEEATPAIEQITGYKRKELIGKELYKISYNLLPGNIRKKIALKKYKTEFERKMIKLKKLLEKNKFVKLEAEIEKKDGSKRYLEEYYYPIEIENRTLIVSIKRDITTEKEAIIQLFKSKEKYKKDFSLFRLIADNSSDFIWAKDKNGRYIFVNKAYAKILFNTEDVLAPLGKRDKTICNKIKRENRKSNKWNTLCDKTEKYDKKVLEEKRAIQYEIEGFLRGKYYAFSVSTAPLFNEKGEVIGIVGSGRDITKEKELEKQKKVIEEEHKRLAMVIEQSTEAVMIADINGNLLYVNPAFEKNTGYSAKEVIGKNPRFLKSGEHSKKFYEKLWNTILSGKTWNGIFKNRRKDGSIFYESAIILPIHNEKGEIEFFAGLKRDITQEKVLREQLSQAQKMEAIGTLTGGIAHDFNNILTVINGYADLLLRKSKDDSPNYKIYKEIRAAGERSTKLIRQLLAFSRKQIYSPEIVNINTLITNLKKMLSRLISEDISIKLNLSPEISLIKADPGQIEQILINLVVNARDAIQESGKTEKRIIISTKDVHIDRDFALLHGGKREGKFVKISVSDNGIGMDRETIKKIFDPFFTTKEKGKGTGLGLSTVYGIIKQNDGFIYVYSEKGKGTVFNIYWPAVEEESKKDTEKDKVEEIKGGNETILLIEDNREVLEFSKMGLSEYGYKIIGMNNPLKVIPFLKKEKPNIDLVISDVVMPGINGKDLIKKIKELYPEAKIIFTSGYTDDEVLNIKIKDKSVNFINKPYTIRELALIVREVLDS